MQIKLSKERDSLAQTSKKLARDLQKVIYLIFFIVRMLACRCLSVYY